MSKHPCSVKFDQITEVSVSPVQTHEAAMQFAYMSYFKNNSADWQKL